MRKVYGNTTKDIETFKNIKNMNIYFEQISMKKAMAKNKKNNPVTFMFYKNF